MKFPALVCALLLVSGCRYSAENYLSRHVLPIDPKGDLTELRFREPDVADGPRPPAEPDLADQIDYLIESAQWESARHVAATQPLRLLVHVHGGRTTAKAGARLADDLITVMGSEGRRYLAEFETPPEEPWAYPIFVQWNSGDVSTAKSRLLYLRQGRHLPVLGPLSSPVILSHDLVRGIARLPRSLAYQIVRDANVALGVGLGRPSFGADSDSRAIARALAAAEAPPFDVLPAEYERSTLAHGWRFLCYFVTQPTKILMQGLFLEGLGQGAWDEMRHRAHALVWRPDTFSGDEPATTSPLTRALPGAELPERSNGALPLLYRRIGELERPVELTLVAHSMGSIAVNDSLRSLDDAIERSGGRLSVPRIIYMAPACSTSQAADALVPFLAHSARRVSAAAAAKSATPTQFYYLALHPVAEADETNVGDLVPRGSLLEWIDVYYTNPATVPERVFGKWTNAIPALPLFASVADQVHFKAFDVDGATFPQKHGQFHKIPFWTQEAYGTDSAVQSFEHDWLNRTCSDVLQDCERRPEGYRPW